MVVPGKKDDCNKTEEEEKLGESEDASNDQSYNSINKDNKDNSQPQQWW
jgi:hypothetical protein